MKKRFLTAAMLAATAAFVLFSGCEQQGADDGGGGYFSGTLSEQPASLSNGDPVPAGTYTLKMLIEPGGGYDPMPYGDVVGTATDGKFSFTLPDTIKEGMLMAVFDEKLSDDDFDPLNIPEHKAFLVYGFAVYDGDDNLVGQLLYEAAEGPIWFLYSSSPFTITGTTLPNKNGETQELNIAVGTGWNTLLIDLLDKNIFTGTPPADAKWAVY